LIAPAKRRKKEILNATRAKVFLAEIVKISTGKDMPAFTIRTWLLDLLPYLYA
jgi:hypothetical protein